jgi:hypothetical protein
MYMHQWGESYPYVLPAQYPYRYGLMPGQKVRQVPRRLTVLPKPKPRVIGIARQVPRRLLSY